jgi:dihydropteroate synthase type 2
VAPENASQSSKQVELFGIVNMTTDSFSDGGRYFEADAALAHARALATQGAHVLELGAASSHPDSAAVDPEEETQRLAPVLDALLAEGLQVAVDTWKPDTQRACLQRGVHVLNDIQGFPDAKLYPELADSACRLVVMHSVQASGAATRVEQSASDVVKSVYAFFEQRFAALERAGVARDRLVLDPGMGFFLGSSPEPSLAVLDEIPHLKAAFGVPLLVSVSRKSFLGALTGRDTADRSAATLAAELFAARLGADCIRTHDVGALRDGLAVQAALAGGTG